MRREDADQLALLLLRVVSALIFIQSGTVKMFGWFGGIPPKGGPAPLMSLAGVAGVLEVVGGLAFLVGFATRPIAFVLSGMMAFAYFYAHQPMGRTPVQNQGIPAVLFCFIFLYFAAHGAGKWSLDAMRRPGRV